MNKYDKVQGEIRILCQTLRLRAYVSVNRKSFRKVTMNTVAEMSRRAALEDFRRPYAVFESCSGKFVDKNDKHWVVDVDDCSWTNAVYVEDVIRKCCPEGDKMELVLPTRSGYHLITRPFDIGGFQLMLRERGMEVPEIKKNHLTLLYEAL